MLDYQEPLKTSIPGIDVHAEVNRQWSAGESILQTLKAEGIRRRRHRWARYQRTDTDTHVDTVMSILGGASRMVFVNVHIGRPWRDPNDDPFPRQRAARYRKYRDRRLGDAGHPKPQRFGADGTHLTVDGLGAVAPASLVATTLFTG